MGWVAIAGERLGIIPQQVNRKSLRFSVLGLVLVAAAPAYNPMGSVHGSRLATAQGRIEGPDGRLYAHATSTCLVFETQSAARTG